MKEKIVIIGSGTHNAYKCDTSKPYAFVDDNVSFIQGIVLTGLSTFLLGIFVVIFLYAFRMPAQANLEALKIFILVMVVIIGLFPITMTTLVWVESVCYQKKLKKLLPDSVIQLGTAIAFVNKRRRVGRKNRLMVKIDGSEEPKAIITQFWRIPYNQKIAIARNGDKEFLLTECTLVEIE